MWQSFDSLDMDVGDHVIPQVTWFKFLRSIVRNDGRMSEDVNHHIQAGWLKIEMEEALGCILI